MKKIVLLILTFQSILVFSQVKDCGTTSEIFKQTHPITTGMSMDELNQSLQNRLDKKRLKGYAENSDGVMRIPVVFHIIYRSFIPIGKQENMSDVIIYDILKNINDAFRKKTGTFWDGDGVDSKIEFCLASIDPNGNSTTGIERINGSIVPDFDNNGVSYTVKPTIFDVSKLSLWDTKSYLNIYIVHKYPNGDGTCFGTGVLASKPILIEHLNYITYIHEIAHYLSLYHIFEDGCNESDCINQGDRVCDTPPTISGNVDYNGFCIGLPTCGTKDLSLVRNYMDYGLMACHNMFTQGQADRMRAAIDTTATADFRSKLATKANLVKTGCDNNVVPRAFFEPNKSIVCIQDTVTFLNYSTNSATSYKWTFENGIPSTSNATNPNVIFIKKGNNKITLTATNAIGSNSYDFLLPVEGIEKPIVQESLLPSGSQHTLTANSTADISWYENDTNNLVIATGNSFTTPVLNKSKTYFVQASEIGQEASVGMKDNFKSTASSNQGSLYFSVYKPLLLKSFKVYTYYGKFKLLLRDKNARIIKEILVDGNKIPWGEMVLNLNIQLSPGEYYFNKYYNNDPTNMWTETLGLNLDEGVFPYKIDGLISLDSTDSQTKTMYKYFYDWKVQEIKCKSEKVPVKASVIGDITGINETTNEGTNFYVYPNPSKNNIFLSYNITKSSSVTVDIFDNSEKNVKHLEIAQPCVGLNIYSLDISDLAIGSYFVKLSTNSGIYTTKFIKVEN